MDRVRENSEKSIEGWTIGVTGIHREASEDDVMDRFSEFGEVKTLHLNLDRHDGYVKGYALLEYEDFDHAKEAVAKCDGTELLGEEIRVDFAFVQPLEEELDQSDWRTDSTHSLARRLGPRINDRYDGDDRDKRNGRRQYRHNNQERFSRGRRQGSPPNSRNYRYSSGRENASSQRRDWDHPDNQESYHRSESEEENYSDLESNNYSRRSYRNKQRSISPRRRRR